MRRTSCGAIAALGVVVCTSPALAEGVSVELAVDAVSSWDEFGEPTNVVLTADLADLAGFGSGQGLIVTGVGFDLTLETFMFSWLSEAEINLDDADAPSGGLTLNPGVGDDFSGMDTYTTPLTKLADEDRFALTNGVLRLEFYESFDDLPGVIDSEWNGTITVQVVIPAPGGGALAVCGLLAATRRRR